MAEPAVATGPVADRRNLEQWLTEVERAAAAQPKTDRKGGLDALRAEVQRTLVTSDGDVISAPGQVWRSLLRPSRLALLAVALVAGGIAAYLATSSTEVPAPPAETAVVEQPVTAPPPAPTLQVLVASRAIGLGERLAPSLLQWQSWPEEAARTDFITEAGQPQAIAEMAGAIARFEFFPGEPIRMAKLAVPGDGYLSSVLEPGQRGVSVPVQADIAAGGFIQPNDHVDVLLTQSVGSRQVADTVLANVRVLAIAHRLGNVDARPAEGESVEDAEATATVPTTFNDGVIATLALDSTEAEIITAARATGTLTLVLRSISDASGETGGNTLDANRRIRLTSPFWTN